MQKVIEIKKVLANKLTYASELFGMEQAENRIGERMKESV